MSPALNRSSALEHFEHSNASEIRNGIMFDFYPGLPHMHTYVHTYIHTYMHTYTHTYIHIYSSLAKEHPP